MAKLLLLDGNSLTYRAFFALPTDMATASGQVTRATVRLPSGEIGHAYALGRDKEKVRLAAILDASWCDESTRTAVEEKIVAPLVRLQAGADAKRRAETAATKVDFFTMVRGED